MKIQDKRLNKLEQKAAPFEREFIAWEGNPWTEEEMEAAIRQDPNGRRFIKSLLAGKEFTADREKFEHPLRSQRGEADPV